MGIKTIHEHLTSAWKTAESDKEVTDMARETEDETKEECKAATVAPKTEGKPSALLQVNCSTSFVRKVLN